LVNKNCAEILVKGVKKNIEKNLFESCQPGVNNGDEGHAQNTSGN
jgi:hypothetical protein